MRLQSKIFCLILLLLGKSSFADDIYNFYFQKGQAPKNVIQGKETTVVDENEAKPPEQENSIVENKVVSNPVSSEDLHSLKQERYHFSFGYSFVSDSVGVGEAYSCGFLARFNPYISLRTEVLYLTPEKNKAVEGLDVERINELRWNGLAALEITPLKINLVGHNFIELGVQLGVQSVRTLVEPEQSGTFTAERQTKEFGGVVGRLALNRNFALEGFARRGAEGKSVTSGGNLAFRF